MTDERAVLSMRRVERRFESPAGAMQVLDGVDLDLREGDFAMLTGPSGSGKSTLLHLAALLDVPSAGRLALEGEEVSGMGEARLSELRRRKIGVVFQRYCLLPRRSVLENVLFRFRYARLDAAAARVGALEALDAVGLADIGPRRAGLLSGGEMQRVAIARAIAARPKLLLADEPTGNLDRRAADAVMECFRGLHRAGVTILMVTHNEALLSSATRRLALATGRLVEHRA